MLDNLHFEKSTLISKSTINFFFFFFVLRFYVRQVVIEDDESYVDVTDLRMSREYSIYYGHWARCRIIKYLLSSI